VELIFDKLSIYIASLEDTIEIMSFINLEWKKGHILSRDKDFFNYEHHHKNQVNFVVSKNSSGSINGVLGFIPTALSELSDVFTVMWKVSKGNKTPMLGVQLLRFLQKNSYVRNILSLGINKETIGIYNYMGFSTGTLNHYVLFNKSILEFKIAKVSNLKFSNNNIVGLEDSYSAKYIKNESILSSFLFEKYKQNIPYKNNNYFIKRYFQHPVYKYDIIGVYDSKSLVSIFVTRIQLYNGAKILRIVDFIGEKNSIRCFTKFISEIVENEGYEYADFYCFGLDNSILESAGFKLINQHSNDLIIPNYFNPFLQKNIPVRFFLDSKEIDRLLLFKGDGDQDRPS